MDQVSHSLGISGDPQGFFLYLLIMVGIFVVISILIYNWLEERRFNKQVESNFSTIEEDALLDDKQQQFFDKFASTTGVLNDQPPEGTFVDENGKAVEDDRSIEDVYAELLETMSKRNRKEKVEPEGVTIDHQQIDVASEPVLEIPPEAVEVSGDQEPTLYIPETAEISDAEIIETDSISTSVAEEPVVNLTFEEADTVVMPVDVTVQTVSGSQESETTIDTFVSDEHAQSEVQLNDPPAETVATDQNDIKAIINRAFKEKYNPNFRAEPEEQEEQEEQAADISHEVVEANADDLDDTDVDEPADHSVNEVEPAVHEGATTQAEPVEEEPPMITESVESDEAPILNFPVEEEPVQVEEPPQPELPSAPLEDEETALDFLKGLDDSDAPEPPIQEQAASEPPILDDAIFQQAEPTEPLGQTYQQLLNADSLSGEQTDNERAPLFVAKTPQEDLQAAAESAEKSGDATENAAEGSSDKAAEGSSDKTNETSEPAAEEKQSVFTDALPALLNPHIDFIGMIEASKGSNAAFILESFSTFHQQFEFPVFVFMQCEQSQWLLLNDVTEVEISRYLERNQPVHITASIQMADRTGPISRNTIQRFKQSLSEVAVTMGATAEWVDPTDPIDRAASLDAFCIEVDKTMFFHLANTQTPFTGIKLKGLVETQGMALEKDGAYKYYDLNTESGIKRSVPDFVLFNRDNHKFTEEMLRTSVIKAVTMQLDIPLVPTSAAALDRMVVIAQSLESSLNAQLVDDKNRQITDVHLARIREQIKSIHAAMQLRGITPGSTHAQRLFS